MSEPVETNKPESIWKQTGFLDPSLSLEENTYKPKIVSSFYKENIICIKILRVSD
jgi:hypothetical protein